MPNMFASVNLIFNQKQENLALVFIQVQPARIDENCVNAERQERSYASTFVNRRYSA